MLNQYYAQSLSCSAGSTPCAWQLVDSALPAGISFDPVAGAVLGMPSRVETGLVTVTAFDPAWPANVTTATLSLTIAPPPFTVSLPAAPAAQVGVAYQLQSSVTGTLGSATWSIVSGALPDGLTLDPQSGVIAGTPSTWGTTTAMVQAQDSWRIDRIDTKPITITVAPAPLQITTGSLGTVEYHQGYQAQLAVSGGTSNVVWSAIGGALPAGVTLDPSGALSGIASAIGTFTLNVQAQDANWPGNNTQANLALVVTAPVLGVSLSASSAGQVGVPYAATALASGVVGAAVWNVAAGGLPPGVVLDSTCGAISGVPTSYGAFSAVVQVRDSYDTSRVSAATLNISVAPSSTEIVLYAADATVVSGTWVRVADPSAAGGASLWNPDRGAAKLATALAAPANYFELTFTAQAGTPYHLWMRGKADKNSWANDSVYVQFSGSVDVNGVPQSRLDSTSATFYSVENGTNAGVAGWGWNDDDYNGFATPIYFEKTGPQTIRIQVREDGLALDQIVLSAGRYLTTSPGAFKNDSTMVPR
jgi:hypothetical protein